MSSLSPNNIDLLFFSRHSQKPTTTKMTSRITSASIIDRNYDVPTSIPIRSSVSSGRIPEWVSGSLIRNGPGVTKIGASTYNHLFDGLAVLHKFTIHEGKVAYSSRPLQSDTFKKNMAAQRIVVSEFGTPATTYTDPCATLFQRWKSTFSSLIPEVSDNAVVNVAYIGGHDELYALGESNFIRQIDPKTLETIGEKTDLYSLANLFTATPHPTRLEDGTVVNVGMSWDKWRFGMEYSFIKVPPTKGGLKLARRVGRSIPSRWRLSPSYFHSFGVTAEGNKAVLIEQPLLVNIPQATLNGFTHKPIAEALRWVSQQKTLLHVVDLSEEKETFPSSLSVRYEATDLFVFHHVNCFEEKGLLVVDVAGYNDAELLTVALSGNGSVLSPHDKLVLRGLTPRRYILPLIDGNKDDVALGQDLLESFGGGATAVVVEKKAGLLVVEVTPQILHSEWLELPQINPKYNGRKYRYVYGISGRLSVPVATQVCRQFLRDDEVNKFLIDVTIPSAAQICKLDVTTGERREFSDSRGLLLLLLHESESDI